MLVDCIKGKSRAWPVIEKGPLGPVRNWCYGPSFVQVLLRNRIRIGISDDGNVAFSRINSSTLILVSLLLLCVEGVDARPKLLKIKSLSKVMV